MLKTSTSQVYQELEEWNNAENLIDESLKILENFNNNSNEVLQIKLLSYKVKGDLLAQKEEKQKAIEYYELVLEIINNNPEKTHSFTNKYLESVQQGFTNLLSKYPDKNLNSQYKKSFKKQYLDELNKLLAKGKWEEADSKTYELMSYVANREKKLDYNYLQIENLSCDELGKIDRLWVDHSNGRFGFSVQKKIWKDTGNRLGIKPKYWTDKDRENYLEFIEQVGWHQYSGSRQRQTVKQLFIRGSLPRIPGFIELSGGFSRCEI